MPRNIYVCFALMLLVACNANGLHSIKSTSLQHGASNGIMATDSKEKSACEAKGGYYSKILGCFDQWCVNSEKGTQRLLKGNSRLVLTWKKTS